MRLAVKLTPRLADLDDLDNVALRRRNEELVELTVGCAGHSHGHVLRCVDGRILLQPKSGCKGYFCCSTMRHMEQPKARGRPRKPDGEKLVRVVLFVPRATALRIERHGSQWAREALKHAKPPVAG